MSALPECISTFREGWIHEDVERVRQAITPDMVYVDPFGSYDGAEAMLKYCRASFRRFRQITMEITRLAVAGNTVGLEWAFGLTGDIPGIEGKRVDLVGAGILELRDGRIRSWHDYWDSAQMARQLGLRDVHELRG